MRKAMFAATIVALSVAKPALAATDGAPGVTSTGSFDISVNVIPQGGAFVQVVGLEDFILPNVYSSPTATTPVPMIEQYVCLNRTDAGLVSVTLTQSGSTVDLPVLRNNATGSAIAGYMFVDEAPGGGLLDLYLGQTRYVTQSGAGCTAASGAGTAHRLRFRLSDLPADPGGGFTGTLGGSFTLTLAVP